MKLHLEHGVAKEDIEPFYYLRRSSTLCGLMVFRFSLTMNELGLFNSNQWGATIAAAHLYSAIRHEQEDFPQWLDMEALIFIHGNKRIFWRDHLPSNPGQYIRAYERATGVSEMVAQRGSGNSLIMPRKLYERGIAPASIVSNQFHNRFCFAHTRPVRTLPAVDHVLNTTAESDITRSLSGLRLLEAGEGSSTSNNRLSRVEPESNHALTTQFQDTHALTEAQLLSALSTRVSQETYTLNFDYFTFHVRCMHLLQAVYSEFKPEIDAKYGMLDWGKAELPLVPAWVFGALEDEEQREKVGRRLRTTMEGIVREEGRREIVALREFWDVEQKGALGRVRENERP
jgi:hypothetical protein